MNIKQVADMFDLTVETIRYYERVGVIPPVKRDKNGYRIFTKRDLNWVFLAKSLRNAGLSIESLIEFATLSQLEGDERLAQKDILKDQLKELDEKIEELIQVRKLLQYKITTYDEHIAKFRAGNISDDDIEELWTMKHINKDNKNETEEIDDANN
ncbi:MerR family transcriptional regulator [Enterococcus plantarum]|uniref:MerR family transcriptional regulator n=1 Tax=Enterococcus plantarum TaxID=1077675 RepID=UPI00084DC58D|nr:MerR family transcriptional regulator [Enterococcus plantarum]MBO0468880.1 MerR family transcriptional regulator [Enterococcus plantarum]OEG18083.1 MerR family transcriptional regulator [Enterococcus plantarum]